MEKQKKNKRTGKPKNPEMNKLEAQIKNVLVENHRTNKTQTFTVSKQRFDQVSLTVKSLYVNCWKLGITLGDIRNIKQSHLKQWLILMNQRRIKPATLKEYCKRLQIWFTWLGMAELIEDPDGFVDGIPSIRKHQYRPLRSLLNTLDDLLLRHNKRHSNKQKVVSFETQNKRKTFYKRYFRDLHEMGYRLTDVKHLKQKHITEWILRLEGEGKSPGTIQGYVSYLRTLCKWIGKQNMMVDPLEVLKDPGSYHRVLVSNEDKTPTNPNATKTVEEVLDEIYAESPLVADQLRLADAFGLRFRELILYKPFICERDGYIEFKSGTKGGRKRRVPIETETQREALARIKNHAVSKHGTTIPKELKSHQWENRCRTLFRRIGFTKKGCGFTPHGLRHGFINDYYTKETGRLSRARGGNMEGIVAAEDRYVRLKISKIAGHSRAQIVNCYLGSNVPLNGSH